MRSSRAVSQAVIVQQPSGRGLLLEKVGMDAIADMPKVRIAGRRRLSSPNREERLL